MSAKDEPPKRRVRADRIGRSLRPLRMSAATAASHAATKLRSIGATEEEKAARLLEFHERVAERYVRELGEMKGAIMKIGQLLSIVDVGMIPERYRELYRRSFGSLLADAPPMPTEVLEETVELELGAPAREIFAWFAPEPLAAASIGQVHEARLEDGTRVAVKVQYPGIAEAVDADLRNGELLATFIRMGQSMMGGLLPRTDPRDVVDEVRERVSEELDYEQEARNQRYFSDLYLDHPAIRVPCVFADYSSTRVLTMEYDGGKRWAEALEAPEDQRVQWAEVIFRFVFGSLDRFTIFNADPHPGNYLFHDDGTVTFLDFGCVKVIPADRLQRNIGVVRALAEGRAADMKDMLVSAGMLAEHDDTDANVLLEWLAGTQRYLFTRPYRFTHADVAEQISRAADPLGEYGHLVKRIAMPKDNVFLSRIDFGLWSLLAALGGANDWRGISDEIWGVGPPATDLGIAEAAWLERQASIAAWPPPHPERRQRFTGSSIARIT